MTEQWQATKGTGWIRIPDLGAINPRRDNADGPRQYFTAKLDNGDFARVQGGSVEGGPETWHFEFDEPFLLAGRDGRCIEVEISLLEGGQYAVKYRPGDWPSDSSGAW